MRRGRSRRRGHALRRRYGRSTGQQRYSLRIRVTLADGRVTERFVGVTASSPEEALEMGRVVGEIAAKRHSGTLHVEELSSPGVIPDITLDEALRWALTGGWV